MLLEELTDAALCRAIERLFAAYRGLWSNPTELLARRVFTGYGAEALDGSTLGLDL